MADPDPVFRPAGRTAPVGVAELAALRKQLCEQRRLIRVHLSTLRDTNRRVGRELAAYRLAGDRGRLWALTGPRVLEPAAPPPSQIAGAEELLRRVLEPGPVRTVEVARQARLAGISPRTLARARSRLGVLATRVGGPADRGAWYCRLPENPVH
ncbi:MAG TPA: hypothetical protein VF112_08445 [Candidatus Dormibacteraeota bacterium]